MSQIKVKRRIPSPKDLAQLLKFRKVIFSPRKRRLSRALTIYDLRDIAKKRTPQAPFDYTDGGADTESSLTRARDAYEKLEFQPKILLNVKDVDLSVNMLGKKMSRLIFENLYLRANANIIVCCDGDAWDDGVKIYNELNGGKLYNKIKIVKLPKDKDICDLKGQIDEYYYEIK